MKSGRQISYVLSHMQNLNFLMNKNENRRETMWRRKALVSGVGGQERVMNW
jgi:hypothetical protein